MPSSATPISRVPPSRELRKAAIVLSTAVSSGTYFSPLSAWVRSVALYSRCADSRSGPSSSVIGQCSWWAILALPWMSGAYA